VDARAVGFGCAQRLAFDHRGQAATGKILVGVGTFNLPRPLLIGEEADDPGRNTGGEAARRDLDAGLDEGAGGNHRGLADEGVVHDHCIHADQRVPFDTATVQHGTVADVAVFANDGVGTGKAMHDTGILEVGAAFEDQPPEIAAQAGAGADIAARADDDITDQDGGRMDEGRRVDHGHDAVDRIDAQGIHEQPPERWNGDSIH
jgi:hypothetical protein